MIDFYQLFKSFREYLSLHNRSVATIRGHLWSLGRFERFIRQYPLDDITQITVEHIREYRRYRHCRRNRYGRQDSVTAQNKHLVALKCFFAFLKSDGYININPVENQRYAKEPKRLPKTALTNRQVKRLLDKPDTRTLLGYRDRTILELLYSTGIRRSELLNLKLEDVDYNEGFLRVNLGKGAKDRVVPIGRIACGYLETYIKGIRPLFYNAANSETLFLSKKGLRMGRNTLGEMIAKYAGRSGLDVTVTTHTFRRSCATEMIKRNANLMHVKQLLGHGSLESVQVYCNLSIVDLKAAHKKYHPRERD